MEKAQSQEAASSWKVLQGKANWSTVCMQQPPVNRGALVNADLSLALVSPRGPRAHQPLHKSASTSRAGDFWFVSHEFNWLTTHRKHPYLTISSFWAPVPFKSNISCSSTIQNQLLKKQNKTIHWALTCKREGVCQTLGSQEMPFCFELSSVTSCDT